MEAITLSKNGQLELDKITKQAKVEAAIGILRALTEAIRDLGQVPNGHLYANLMGKMSFEDYSMAIEIIKGSGLIKEVVNELIWVG